MPRKRISLFDNFGYLSMARTLLRGVMGHDQGINKILKDLEDRDRSQGDRSSAPASKSTLWKVLRALRGDMGIELFEGRPGLPARLREDRIPLAKKAVDIIDQIERLIASLRDLGSGLVDTVRVATYPSISTYLMPTVSRMLFDATGPGETGVHVDVRLTDGYEAIEGVRSGRVDIALFDWHERYNGGEIVGRRLPYRWADKGVIFREGDLEAGDDLTRWREWDHERLQEILAGKRLVLTSGRLGFDSHFGGQYFDKMVGNRLLSLRPDRVTMVPTYRHVLAFVRRGVGVGIGPDPRSYGRTPSDDRLGFIPIQALIAPEELLSSNVGWYGIYLRKGSDALGDGKLGTATASAAMVAIIDAVCADPRRDPVEARGRKVELSEADLEVLDYDEAGHLMHNPVY